MPITSGFSDFPHFTQRLLLTTSTYSFYFIFFYAKRERILRERTHGVWKRWVQICFYFLIMFFSLVRKERKGQKEEGIDSRLGDADTHASHMCQSLFWTPFVASRRPVRTKCPDRPAIAYHGYRFETLKRRLGFTAVPCQAMANLAVQVWAHVWVRT